MKTLLHICCAQLLYHIGPDVIMQFFILLIFFRTYFTYIS